MIDTPTEAVIGDAAAKELQASELKLLPAVGEICPSGTLVKLAKIKSLLQELRRELAV
jgi:hypothetical protein